MRTREWRRVRDNSKTAFETSTRLLHAQARIQDLERERDQALAQTEHHKQRAEDIARDLAAARAEIAQLERVREASDRLVRDRDNARADAKTAEAELAELRDRVHDIGLQLDRLTGDALH